MDRRIIWAIVLMMIIAIVPTFLLKPTSRPIPPPATATPDTGAPPPVATAPVPQVSAPPSAPESGLADSLPGDTVRAFSAIYRYEVSTIGGRLIRAELPQYRSMAPGRTDSAVQLLHRESDLLGLKILVGNDTVRLDRWSYTPSATSLNVTAPSTLRLSSSRQGVSVELAYRFLPDRYLFDVQGTIHGLGPNGGVVLIGLGPGIRNTEADSGLLHRSLAVVTKASGTQATPFSKLKPGETRTLDGPFEWVAVKSEYFVTAIFAMDSTQPGITGVTATPPPNAGKQPSRADVELSMAVGAEGAFHYQVYAGPMEYSRLGRIGHDFDDVNPYGWPGFRTVIRPVALAVRWTLVWMHQHLHLAYGIVLILFGILIRVLLWPLNQKAMRSSMAMQAIQPELKAIQEKHKDNPQKLQQEMFKLYKEHNVNPLGGCLPLLIPLPVLFALFFVFESTIELRGTPFLWLHDLSRPDPYYIIPLIMGGSMYVLNKIAQRGMQPNPQTKIMLYAMPVVMTVLFAKFASGLNLYYSVSNIVSIPQQWWIAQERLRKQLPQAAKPKG